MPFFCAVLRRFRAVFSVCGGWKERRIIGAQREEIGVRKGMEEAVRTVRSGGAGGCGSGIWRQPREGAQVADPGCGDSRIEGARVAEHGRPSAAGQGLRWGGIWAVSVRPGYDFSAEILPYSYYLVYLRI